ncbi:glucuronate isomerase [Halieaceae bacterium IMCC14734]|uniref:Uronate isomerase n=1 Tax=Candidatus Litorirhabdus singularis TaxID=2518993 RepID=A0ABT3TJZ4_9GAMM|nr:glucuronate isomerase [Candidatus Litorirhabdus singularis]MCX2982096.1 glucuronate isomerase [Candidatus Litorirhabdus singularis]
MSDPLQMHPDRLLPAEPATRNLARQLYQAIKDLPIISPHGHTDAQWFASNDSFTDATALFITPDHYVFRMLYSQGITLEQLGIGSQEGAAAAADPREIWRLFSENYTLFQGTPSRLWLDHVFAEVFGMQVRLDGNSSDTYFDTINAKLSSDEFRPRALFERFNIELLATTESPLDALEHHASIIDSDWQGRVITTYRPDPVVDPDYDGFKDNLIEFGQLTGEDTSSWRGYLNAHRTRREYFKRHGATATDHGHPTAGTENLDAQQAEKLFQRVIAGDHSPSDAEQFRGQMLTEMAAMSLDDDLVMQLHPGSYRNHNQSLYERFGRDKGADIPRQTEYVQALKPLLDKYGNEPGLSIILFTLDETAYSRELAPLAGHYPSLLLGPAWWFHDSPEGMRRFRQQTTETAGFYNTAGFNDDTRAFLSIPARHDVARRIDCGYLAELVTEHRLTETEAAEIAVDLTNNLARKAYRL